MIQPKDLLSLSYYELAVFTGSDNGLRYRIEKHTEEDTKTLLATAWNGPFAFDHTPAGDMETFTADFSPEGLVMITDWLNSRNRQEP